MSRLCLFKINLAWNSASPFYLKTCLIFCSAKFPSIISGNSPLSCSLLLKSSYLHPGSSNKCPGNANAAGPGSTLRNELEDAGFSCVGAASGL